MRAALQLLVIQIQTSVGGDSGSGRKKVPLSWFIIPRGSVSHAGYLNSSTLKLKDAPGPFGGLVFVIVKRNIKTQKTRNIPKMQNCYHPDPDRDLQCGICFHWVKVFFPNHPKLGKPLNTYSLQERVDWLLAHSIQPSACNLSDAAMAVLMEGVYFFPRVYPADLHGIIMSHGFDIPATFQGLSPVGRFRSHGYRPFRYKNDLNVPRATSATKSLPFWIQAYEPTYPALTEPSNWSQEEMNSFCAVWNYSTENASVESCANNHKAHFGHFEPPVAIPQRYIEMENEFLDATLSDFHGDGVAKNLAMMFSRYLNSCRSTESFGCFTRQVIIRVPTAAARPKWLKRLSKICGEAYINDDEAGLSELCL